MRGRQKPVLKSLVRRSVETTVTMPMGQLFPGACGLVQLELDCEFEVCLGHGLIQAHAIDEERWCSTDAQGHTIRDVAADVRQLLLVLLIEIGNPQNLL